MPTGVRLVGTKDLIQTGDTLELFALVDSDDESMPPGYPVNFFKIIND